MPLNKPHNLSVLNRSTPRALLVAGACTLGLSFSATAIHAQIKDKKEFTEKELIAAARKVDVHIAKIYKRKRASIPKDATDAVFLRRSFLLAAGRIPTVEEARVFLESEDPNKRLLLVRYLMKSKGYDSHMGNWLVDMLRVQEDFESRRTAAPYMAWVRKAVRENMPYHDMTRELLSAQGSIWENGAVGYYIRDKGMPLDNMSNTMRLFLGTRMECAQCHDHPFDNWERMDFYRLAAFSNGQTDIKKKVWGELWGDMGKKGTQNTPLGRLVRYLGDEVYYSSLTGAGTGRIKLPDDYQYSDGDPNEWVGAKTPFGKSVRMSDRSNDSDGMERFAAWVASPENIQFTTIITNRMWKRIIGTGLFEPIDEYVEANRTTSPEMTNYLVRLMQDLNYDLKAFQQVLMLTRVYAFESSNKPPAFGEQPIFDGRKIERMSAEQYWDSLVTLISGNPDKLPTRGSADDIVFTGKVIRDGQMTMQELQKEVLALDTPQELLEYTKQLMDDMNNSSKSSNRKREDSRVAMKGIARASELESPAPAGHVLRIFGQSDRVLLDSATRESNPTQVLSMMNGQVEKLVVANHRAHIHKLSKGTEQDRIRSLFMGTLSRLPTDSEMIIMQEEVKERGDEGYRNIVSALVNTREFLFIP